MCKVLEPCVEKGRFRPEIDLVSAAAWQHSALFSRVHIEHGQENVDPAEWDRLAVEAIEHTFYG
jgi:hypothetical protein